LLKRSLVSPRAGKCNLPFGEYKSDRRNVELYGGTAAVVADALNRWFAGLWHGRPLAYTLAVLAIGIALACFLAARHLSDESTDDQS